MHPNTIHIATTHALYADLSAHFGDSTPSQDELTLFIASWHLAQTIDENWLTMDTVISASKLWLERQARGVNHG